METISPIITCFHMARFNRLYFIIFGIFRAAAAVGVEDLILAVRLITLGRGRKVRKYFEKDTHNLKCQIKTLLYIFYI